MRIINVVATCLVVGALMAGPVAAAVVVHSADIVDGQVKTVDLANAAITNKKLATNAVNGAKLDESTLGIVPNSNLLDGRDSSSFVVGPGRVVAASATVNRGVLGPVFNAVVAPELGFNIAYQCPGGPTGFGMIQFRSRSSSVWKVWYQDGGDGPVFVEVAAGGTAEFWANETSHSVKFRLYGARGQATVIYSLTGEPTTCKTSAMAILSN